MKTSLKYRLLTGFSDIFFAALFLSFGFFIARSRTEGNVAYWVIKGICVGYLALLGIIAMVSKGRFSKLFPLTIVGFAIQLLPLLMRIGWTGDNPKVPVAWIYVVAIVLFLCFVVSAVFAISHNTFAADEDRAKPSSNAKQ